MGSVMEESIKFTTFLSPLSHFHENNAVVAFAKTIPEKSATWSYVTQLSVEENRRLSQRMETLEVQAYITDKSVAVAPLKRRHTTVKSTSTRIQDHKLGVLISKQLSTLWTM